MNLYALDIETDTTINGLDPDVAAITAIAIYDGNTSHVFTGDETRILTDTERALRYATEGVIVTWNGASFDLPFMHDRAKACNVSWGLNLTGTWPAGKYGALTGHSTGYTAVWNTVTGSHGTWDVSENYREWAQAEGVKFSLKPVARAAGITVVEVDRENIHQLSETELHEYVASDAAATWHLARKALGWQ